MQADRSRGPSRQPGSQVKRLERQLKAVAVEVGEPASRPATAGGDPGPGRSHLFSLARKRLSDRQKGQSGTGTATETHAALRGAGTPEHANPRYSLRWAGNRGTTQRTTWRLLDPTRRGGCVHRRAGACPAVRLTVPTEAWTSRARPRTRPVARDTRSKDKSLRQASERRLATKTPVP